jgi:predicted O-methyltransferase YrrM
LETFEQLNEAVRAFQVSRVLLTAVELDVFEAVGAGATAEWVAEAVDAEPRATTRLLNALVSLGLLCKEGEVYSNSELAARHLTSGSPDDSRGALMHQVGLWTRWTTLTDAVRAGTRTLPVGREDAPGTPDTWTRAFIAAMHRNASERAPLVVHALDLDGVQRVLDLGGGSGAYSIAFAQAQPGLKAEVLDLPEVVGLTREYAQAAGLADRVTAHAGDFEQDDYGDDYDLVWISQICHMMGPDENLSMLHKAYAALAPGGCVAVQEFLLDPDRAGPRQAALFALNMLVGTTSGDAYTQAEISGWLEQVGLHDIASIHLAGGTSLVLGRK